MKIIFHLDLDAFFVSVERILDPSLKGKPVVVGGDPTGRGVVAACSYEARKFGLRSGMPIGRAYKLCSHGIYLKGNHKEYSRFSEAVRNIIEEYAPMYEQASIDEFYMDFSGCAHIYGSYMNIATFLQNKIWEELSLPSSVGIGTTKTIAKICSDYNKPFGVTYVIPGMEKEFLRKLPAEKMPGIGEVTIKQLHAKGFYTLGQIADSPVEYFAKVFGKSGIDIWEKSNGKGPDILLPPSKRKSISKETTFETDVNDKAILKATLFRLTAKVCHYLRESSMLCSTVGIKLRYSDFKTITREKTIKPTDDDKTVYETIIRLFEASFARRVNIRLIGVHLSNFTENIEQPGLFDRDEQARSNMLKAVNKIREMFGYSSVKIGSE